MKTNRYFGAQIVFAFFLFAFFSNSVQAETTECTVITSLPYTITAQGIYCLKGNLATSMTSGSAITITTNNVVLDLNGFKLGGLGAGTGTQANGIYAYQKLNITIRNGTVRGFFYGILLADASPYATSQGHLIEDIRADMNTYVGIVVHGQGNIIRNNQVVSTGGSTIKNNPSGIVARGPEARVLNNDVIETKEQSTAGACGIYLNSAPGAVVEGNRIGNKAMGSGTSIGVDMDGSSDVAVVNNRITKMTIGVNYENGSTGGYRDNIPLEVTTQYIGGTDTARGTVSWDRIIPNAADRFKMVLDGAGVLDKETGLVWESFPNLYGNWDYAFGACFQRCYNYSRYGWRLPTMGELSSLIDVSVNTFPRLPPGYDSYFHSIIQEDYYWTANPYTGNYLEAYAVSFKSNTGVGGAEPKAASHYIWCVRGGQTPPVGY